MHTQTNMRSTQIHVAWTNQHSFKKNITFVLAYFSMTHYLWLIKCQEFSRLKTTMLQTSSRTERQTCMHTHSHTVLLQASVRKPAFSTVIIGLYKAITHSSLRLALVQMERQWGKGTGCHNLASLSEQEPQLQTHMDKQARAPTPELTHMHASIPRNTHSPYLLYIFSQSQPWVCSNMSSMQSV